ncbi:hypothetical protein GGI17_004664 [Coemansia sp. S146]|nr:hypothetical protein GGI17_004664 [Coemansia sp. S146]
MQMTCFDVSMLHKYKVFVPGSHPRLQVVKISYNDDFGSELLASSADIMQFMYSIGSGAAMQEYALARYLLGQICMPTLLGGNAYIQVLSLPRLCPALWDVITLIKSLPLLSDLHTLLPRLWPIADGATMDSLPEHIISNYAPMGRRFRCWHLKGDHVHDHTELATCVLLLALVCPNFDYAVPPTPTCKLFMNHMEKVIDSDLFKPYAPRLRRLLFYGWNGKQD